MRRTAAVQAVKLQAIGYWRRRHHGNRSIKSFTPHYTRHTHTHTRRVFVTVDTALRSVRLLRFADDCRNPFYCTAL